MKRFFVLTRSLLTIMARNRTALFANIVLPVGLLLVLGSIFSQDSQGGIEAAAWLMAGVMVQNLMNSGLEGDMGWLTSTRDRGVLLRVRATPLPPALLVGAYVLARLLMVLAQTAVIAAVAIAVLGVRLDAETVPLALGSVMLGALVFLSLGQAIAATARDASTAGAIANLAFFPLLFLSDLVIQVDALPAWLQQVTRWNPAFMTVDLLRPALLPIEATQAAWINIVGLCCYGVLALALAARYFRWEPRR